MNNINKQYTNKILAIVVSRNRAAQLDLLLRSFDKFAQDKFDIKVVHRYDDSFKKGLDKARSKFTSVDFIEEKDFRGQILELLANTTSLTTTFMTDDTCWRYPFGATDQEMAELLMETNMFSFLLRCGLNTIRQCHYTNEMQQPLAIQWIWYTEHLQVASYNFRQHRWETDFGRPFSLDGSISLVGQLKNILEQTPWSNPRELDAINDRRDTIMGMTGMCQESFVVTQSVNQSFDGPQADNWGKYVSYGLAELEEKYVGGQVIKMDQEKYLIQSSHVELEFSWEND